MQVELITVAYNSGDGLTQLVRSASSARHDLRMTVFLHSAHEQTVAACRELVGRDDVQVHGNGANRGLARSWNDGILAAYGRGADRVVVANDDITFAPGDIDRLVETADRHDDAHIISCAGPHLGFGRRLPSHGFACFVANPVLLDVLGCFDENFFPAYCEDQDLCRRAALAALHEANCAETEVAHQGSASIARDAHLRAQNSRTHALNQAYYRRKWGGEPGAESFDRPFGDPGLGVRIAPEHRRRPYGRHDRVDLPDDPW